MSSALPHQQNISGTSGTEGAQVFAGTNLGTVNYSNSAHLGDEAAGENKLTLVQTPTTLLRICSPLPPWTLPSMLKNDKMTPCAFQIPGPNC